VCVCADRVWRQLVSLSRDVKAIDCCNSFVDMFIDQDDFLIESLLRLSNIHSSCKSVSFSAFSAEM